MLTDAQIASFDRDGYVLGPKVLDDAEVEILRAETLRVIEDCGKKDQPQPVLCHVMGGGNPEKKGIVWQIVNIWQASPAFQKLVHNPRVTELAARLLRANELRIWHDQVQYKPSSDGGVNMWHQDGPYWPTLTPQDQQVTAWIALDDAAQDNGCMSMVPGSHKWGRQVDFLHTLKGFDGLPSEYDGHKIEVRLAPVKAGHVHFHHSYTWHGSHANTSGRPRRAIALHFMNEKTCYSAKGSHVMNKFVKVAPGEKIEGEAFQLVWSAGVPVAG